MDAMNNTTHLSDIYFEVNVPMPSENTTRWRDLISDPPTEDRCVILFPQITNVGILFAASNPHYARKNAARDGYTHWLEIDLLPGTLEADAEARCAEIRRLDGLEDVQPLARVINDEQ